MRLLRKPDLKVLKGITFSDQTRARMEARGDFPRHVTLTGSRTYRPPIGWIEEEVDAWIAARAAERREVDR